MAHRWPATLNLICDINFTESVLCLEDIMPVTKRQILYSQIHKRESKMVVVSGLVQRKMGSCHLIGLFPMMESILEAGCTTM